MPSYSLGAVLARLGSLAFPEDLLRAVSLDSNYSRLEGVVFYLQVVHV